MSRDRFFPLAIAGALAWALLHTAAMAQSAPAAMPSTSTPLTSPSATSPATTSPSTTNPATTNPATTSPDTTGAPPQEVIAVQAYGDVHPDCAEWTDGCVVCARGGGKPQCSTPGIACQPATIACSKSAPK